jgi:son of sevenless-like protein
MEIVAGLNNSAVHRLRNTFAALPQKTTALLTELEDLLQQKGNYQKLRTAIHNCTPPCIPYLGIYLTDLTFIEDGNKDNNEMGLINFTKRKQIAAVIREIQQYQCVCLFVFRMFATLA